jgi:hypothetical protein
MANSNPEIRAIATSINENGRVSPSGDNHTRKLRIRPRSIAKEIICGGI